MQRDQQQIGPMIGHTTSTTARVWLRANLMMREEEVNHTIAFLFLDDTLIEEQTFHFLPDMDHIGVIEFGANGRPLLPDTRYQYKVEVHHDGEAVKDIAKSHFHTFSDSADKEVAFVTGSCRHLYIEHNVDEEDADNLYIRQKQSDVDYGDQAFKSIRKLMEREESPIAPQFMLMTGDQVYADHEEGSFHGIINPSKTLAEYIDNYHRAYPQKHFAALAKTMPFYMTMDDHEIKNDWMMDMINLECDRKAEDNITHYKNGLHAYAIYQAALSSVIKNTKQLNNELGEIKDISYEKNLPQKEQPYQSTTKGLHYTFEQGPAKFFVLDVRTERYMHKDKAQMIGEHQQQALYDWLDTYRDDEHVKFIVSAVPVFPDTRFIFGASEDKWAGYSEQRKEVLDYIRENNIKKVVFLSGDVHLSLTAKLQYDGKDTGIYSIVSSAFTWPVPGLNRLNFDWNALTDRSIHKGMFWKKRCQKKRKPDYSSRGKYQAVELTHRTWFVAGHKKHNFCYVKTDGEKLYVSYYRSKNGDLVERLTPINL